MPTPEEQYYDSMNTVLAPVRWAESLVQTVLLIGIAIFIGLVYPLILLANHMPIDFPAIVVPFMTILTIFTFCYAPYYFLFGGAVFAVAWATAVIQIDGFPKSLGANEAYGFIFLTVGILQRHIRRTSSAAQDEPKQEEHEPKKVTFAEMVEEARLERRQQEYDAMSPEERAVKTRRFGDDYFNWPDEFTKGSQSGTAAEDGNRYTERSTTSTGSNFKRVSVCEKCTKAFGLLDLPFGASDEEVNSKKRAFAELLHDDRLAAMSDNARRIAKEQHQSVNEACSHILTCPVRAKSKGNTEGSVGAPVPHQSTSDATRREKTERRSSPASSSGESELARQEHGHKVLSEQERIDALDATRERVDELTKDIHDFIEEQRKKLKQRSLGRL